MSAAANKALLRRVVDEGFNRHDPAALDRWFPAAYAQHTEYLPRDRAGLRQSWGALWAAFPDWRGSVELLVAEADLAFAFTVWQGTHTGAPYLGAPAASRAVSVQRADLYRVADGQLVEHWGTLDRLGLRCQLGLAPQMPRPGDRPAALPAGAPGTPAANKALLRRVMDELFNRHDLARADAYYWEHFIQHNLDVAQGREGFKQFFGARFAAFPDWHGTADPLLAEDDLVVAYITWRGTHTGTAYLGVPPSGKVLTYRTADAFRVVNGQLVEHWDVPDRLGTLAQLGLLQLSATSGERGDNP